MFRVWASASKEVCRMGILLTQTGPDKGQHRDAQSFESSGFEGCKAFDPGFRAQPGTFKEEAPDLQNPNPKGPKP